MPPDSPMPQDSPTPPDSPMPQDLPTPPDSSGSPTPGQLMQHEPSEASVALSRVVVLAGGGSRRLGQDKLAADLGDRTVLGALLDGLRSVVPNARVVLVGPPERGTSDVLVVREDPPGGGPVAALAAGLQAALTAAPAMGPATDRTAGPTPGRTAELTTPSTEDDLVAVLAGDQPFAAAALPLLAATLKHRTPSDERPLDGAVGVDPDGRDQPLLAVYRTESLRRALAEQAAESGLTGARVRDVVARLRLARVPLPDTAALDVDTAQDLERARAVVRREADTRRP